MLRSFQSSASSHIAPVPLVSRKVKLGTNLGAFLISLIAYHRALVIDDFGDC